MRFNEECRCEMIYCGRDLSVFFNGRKVASLEMIWYILRAFSRPRRVFRGIIISEAGSAIMTVYAIARISLAKA